MSTRHRLALNLFSPGHRNPTYTKLTYSSRSAPAR
jgi:hypothetical protein